MLCNLILPGEVVHWTCVLANVSNCGLLSVVSISRSQKTNSPSEPIGVGSNQKNPRILPIKLLPPCSTRRCRRSASGTKSPLMHISATPSKKESMQMGKKESMQMGIGWPAGCPSHIEPQYGITRLQSPTAAQAGRIPNCRRLA
jgi:hypothetical protein